jgi:acetyl-CoA carboxylase biotin carboxyl carrier protein
MKVMNEVQADQGGEIIEILVEDSVSVEYGQPLFKIRKK